MLKKDSVLLKNLMSNGKIKLQILLIATFSLVILLGLSTSIRALPIPTGYMVNDWANVLYSSEEEDLEGLCRWIEFQTTVEIFLVTTSDLEGYDLDRYANVLFNEWGIGKPDVNNGILLVLFYEDLNDTHFSYDFRIEIGQGMEGAITDAEAGRIGRDNVSIWINYGYFYDGFNEGIIALYNEFKDDPSVRAGLQPFSLQSWAFQNPLLAGLIVGIPLSIIFSSFRFALNRFNPLILLFLIVIGIGLLVFAWWLDPIPPFLVFLYTLAIGVGGGIMVSGASRVRGGGGRSRGGGWST